MFSAEREKARIVIVDDEEDFLQLIRTWLIPQYDVVCLSSGTGLIEELDDLQPDLLILDVHMPEQDGFKLCRLVRSKNRFSSLPILFLTASRNDDDFAETIDVLGSAFLNKPVNKKQLQSKLRELLAFSPRFPNAGAKGRF